MKATDTNILALTVDFKTRMNALDRPVAVWRRSPESWVAVGVEPCENCGAKCAGGPSQTMTTMDKGGASRRSTLTPEDFEDLGVPVFSEALGGLTFTGRWGSHVCDACLAVSIDEDAADAMAQRAGGRKAAMALLDAALKSAQEAEREAQAARRQARAAEKAAKDAAQALAQALDLLR